MPLLQDQVGLEGSTKLGGNCHQLKWGYTPPETAQIEIQL